VSGPRIAPGGLRDVGLFGWLFSRVAGRVMGTEAPNLFLTLGRHRRLFRGWLRFAARLMPRGRLPRRESELVILRVAHLRGCGYEEAHHVRLGRRAGLIDQDFARVREGPAAAGWSAREATLLAVADEMVTAREVGDGTWEAMRAHLDEREAIELVLLAGHYDMLATAIATLRIRTDAPRR
jgi:AhpD family alkylhydroperoxidase